jgi:hypothetical protein
MEVAPNGKVVKVARLADEARLDQVRESIPNLCLRR